MVERRHVEMREGYDLLPLVVELGGGGQRNGRGRGDRPPEQQRAEKHDGCKRHFGDRAVPMRDPMAEPIMADAAQMQASSSRAEAATASSNVRGDLARSDM